MFVLIVSYQKHSSLRRQESETEETIDDLLGNSREEKLGWDSQRRVYDGLQ